MRSPILLSICAGLLAAVVFASTLAAPMALRLPLFLLTPLPLVLAGLAFGWKMAAAAGSAGIAAMLATGGPRLALVFAATEAIPVVAVTYLALLNRPVRRPGAEAGGVEWYPVGRVVIWVALLAGALSALSLLMLGGDADALRKTLRPALDAFVQAQASPGAQAIPAADIDALTEMAVALFPALTAMSWMCGLLFTLWLAGRILLAAGRLSRPWPDLAAMNYPRGTPLVLAALMLSPVFVTGFPALASSAFAGSFFLAYVLLGLAVLHFITRGQAWRPFALWTAYAGLLLLNWIIAPMLVILGLSETIISLRGRRPPPPDNPRRI